MKIFIVWALAVLALSVSTVQAMPCHCFPSRQYESANPTVADPYFLATAQNSFMAVVFSMDKKDVVLAKQRPATTAEGLWVAQWLADRTGLEPTALLKAKRGAGSWGGAAKELTIEVRKLPPQFAKLLAAGASEAGLSREVVDSLLVGKGLVPPAELEMLRRAGASDQETILAVLVARKGKRKPEALLRLVRDGKASWGGLIAAVGMNGGDMVSEIRLLVGNGGGSP